MDTDLEIAERLIESNLLARDDLDRARHIAAETRQRLRRVLVQMGLASESDVAECLAAIFGIAIYDIDLYTPTPDLVLSLSEEMCVRHKCIVLEEDNGHLVVAMENPLDLGAIEDIERHTGRKITPVLGAGSSILRKVSEYRDHFRRHVVTKLLREVTDTGIELARKLGFEIASLEDVAREESEAVRAVHLLILQALQDRASDIHVEPVTNALRIRYRIDGQLIEVNRLPWQIAAAVISRIKVMANLNIAERRRPQDGHFHITIEKRGIDFRVAVSPTILGEKVVIRILDRSAAMTSLDVLGFDQQLLRDLRRLLQLPHGMILVSGPTGSGKTTTLYGALESLGARLVNITTVEDPVEYQVDGITQIQVHPEIGLDFARVLRSILRQDPDVIFVGEIRDPETAQIAVRAALTGHLVLATVHTNDAPSAVTRMLDMNIEPYLLASCLRAVLAQRLVRNNCRNCLIEAPYDAAVFEELGLDPSEQSLFRRGIGCSQCFLTGFRGRNAIAELLVSDNAIQSAIGQKRPAAEIRQIAAASGFRTIREDGLRLARSGETTPGEIIRATEALEE